MNREVSLKDLFPLIDEQLKEGGFTVFAVHGTSMQPFLKDRESKVRLEKPKEAPKKYDVIFYTRPDGSFILHRIVGIKDGGFVCRGDNQTENEFSVSFDRVIATVTQYDRKGIWRSMDGLSQRIFARFWVNTVLFRKITRKTISFLRRK